MLVRARDRDTVRGVVPVDEVLHDSAGLPGRTPGECLAHTQHAHWTHQMTKSAFEWSISVGMRPFGLYVVCAAPFCSSVSRSR